MSGGADDGVIGLDLARQVFAAFAVRGPLAPDLDGLHDLYHAWCQCVPFDNLRKMIALREGGGPLPGIRAADFLRQWLEDRSGGTCWATGNALCALLAAAGFQTRCVAGAMRDLGITNHGSVKVLIDGQDWLADPSMLTDQPLPLQERVLIRPPPVHAIEVEPDAGTHIVWFQAPPAPEPMPCRLVADPVDQAFYADAYERSRLQSPFNQRLYARRNREGKLLVLTGRTRVVKSAGGMTIKDLEPEELLACLRDEFGISESLIRRWEACGGLRDSLQPPSGPRPPAPARRAPSLRPQQR